MKSETPTPREIKAARRRFEMTQQGLADVVGVKQSTVWRWEAGRSTPKGAALVRLKQIVSAPEKQVVGMGTSEEVHLTVFREANDDWTGVLTTIERTETGAFVRVRLWFVKAPKVLFESEGAFAEHMKKEHLPDFISDRGPSRLRTIKRLPRQWEETLYEQAPP